MNDNVLHLKLVHAQQAAKDLSPQLRQLFVGTVWIIDESETALLDAAKALLAASLVMAQIKVARVRQDLAAMHDAAGRFQAEIEVAKNKAGQAFVMASSLHAETTKHTEIEARHGD
ncbi:hypothetical protein [Bradyrhizobium lablabi]|uniref:hypothetical protein n=1 Tax=Bradyrhizobium lablabi TaxID=722472 RepID=UPI001BA6604B|nr:hypothetical protein [Bradyrhizobium lablabi]MBR0693613.1 hypothetical protein [Bradyrhizobium lablabi]